MLRRTPAGSLREVAARTVAVPAVGGEQGGEHAQRGGLAGAVRAEEADELARRDVEVDARDGLHRPRLVLKVRTSPRAWITRGR